MRCRLGYFVSLVRVLNRVLLKQLLIVHSFRKLSMRLSPCTSFFGSRNIIFIDQISISRCLEYVILCSIIA